MKCEEFITGFLESDDFSNINLKMRLHMLRCANCKQEAHKMTAMMKDLRETSPYRINSSVSNIIMSQILVQESFKESRITWGKWLLIGAVIFFSLFLINFSDSFIWLKSEFGANFTVPVSIVLGSIFTLYAIIVTGINYESMQSVITNYLKKLYKY